jgi:predicted  nucleic acid-binding Zn-ribbon protein
MQPTLQALLHLQEVDRDIFRVQSELKRLPAERAVRAGELEKRAAKIAEQRLEAKKLRVRIKEIEDQTVTQRQRMRKVEHEAAGSRQDMALLVAYQHEIKTLKKDINTAEEEGLQLLERVEAIESQAAAAQADLDAEAQVFAELSANIEREIAAAEKRFADLSAERRRRMAHDILPETLSLYTRLLAAREGVAMAPLEGRQCQACYMELPTNVCLRVARGVEVVQCPSCDRILFPKE